ncbi:MAG: ankyrin repeat domain-containing protein [Spirochaetales bacterium]|nr:ankyrin repeat domain-containing protein [Spirochaetales bacterium]
MGNDHCKIAAALAVLLLTLLGSGHCGNGAAESELVERGYEATRYGFMLATRAGDAEAVRLFLAAGFSAETRFDPSNLENDAGAVPLLLYAAESGNPAVVRILLDAGADPRASVRAGGIQAIHTAARYAKPEIVRMLVQAGADPNAIGQPRFEGGAFVPLYEAVHRGETPERVETVRVLLALGAACDPRHPRDGDSPLLAAKRYGYDEIARLLLACGADPQAERTR